MIINVRKIKAELLKYLTICCIGMVWGFVLEAGFSPLATFADALDDMKVTAGKITSIRGNFIQEKQMPILAQPLISKGRFLFQKPLSLRWEYVHPMKSILIMHDGRAHRYNKAGERWQKDKGAAISAMDVVFEEIAHWMNGRFDKSTMFSAASTPDGRIILTPKDQSMVQFIQRIELILSSRPGVIKTMTLYESELSFTRLSFIDPQVNQVIPETDIIALP